MIFCVESLEEYCDEQNFADEITEVLLAYREYMIEEYNVEDFEADNYITIDVFNNFIDVLTEEELKLRNIKPKQILFTKDILGDNYYVVNLRKDRWN